MFVAAARVLSDFSPALQDEQGSLYPPLERVREISKSVALAVAHEAQESGLAEVTNAEGLERRVSEKMWQIDR